MAILGVAAGCTDVVEAVDWREERPPPGMIQPSLCFEVPEAVRLDNEADLIRFNIPTTIDPDIIIGEVGGLHCTSGGNDREGFTYTFTVIQDSGQVLVFRTTNSVPPPENSAEQTAAIAALDDRVGAFAVTGDQVVRLETVPPAEGGVPISTILD